VCCGKESADNHILTQEFVFRLEYFSGIFLSVVIVLTILFYCTFRRIGLLSFYIFLRVDEFLLCF
jgi:hypothetical protein